MCSIAASMATMAFNKYFIEEAHNKFQHIEVDEEGYSEEDKRLFAAYSKAIEKGAMFDSRCFNIPKEEAANLIYWRQVDAMRNSVQMVGQANYSHSYLQDKSCEQIKALLRCDFGINWDGLPARWKYGCAWTKSTGLDYNMPVIKGENRAYVENEVYCEEE
jgi:tRNA(His) 5'-end guanylyltransferase